MPKIQLISITQTGRGRSYRITDQASMGRQALVANDVISIGHHAFVFAPNF